MKKNDLIKLLQSIEGNPEILLWNGTVGDWQDIDKNIQPGDLVRMTKKYWLDSCERQDQKDMKDWTYKMPEEEVLELSKKYSKVCKWERNPWVTQEAIDSNNYALKKVMYLEPKRRNETSYSRSGSVEY